MLRTWMVISTLVMGMVTSALAYERDADAPSLETIKRLVGEWEELDENGEPTGKVISSYRVVSGGTAVLETDFPGTDHEMVTIYREEDGALVSTHYCVLGNQPSYRARRTAPNQLVFELTEVSGLDSKAEAHMRHGTVTWVDEDHIETEWRQYENGENNYTAAYRLVRKK